MKDKIIAEIKQLEAKFKSNQQVVAQAQTGMIQCEGAIAILKKLLVDQAKEDEAARLASEVPEETKAEQNGEVNRCVGSFTK